MDEKDLKEALETTTEKGATRSGYEQLIRQKLALKDDVDLSTIDDNTLKAMAGTDDDAIADDSEATEDTKVTFGDQLGLEDKEDIEAVNDMSDEDKDKLMAAVAGDKENMKESVSWTVECYNLMEAADIDLAIALKEHCGLKKDEIKEILKERRNFPSSEETLKENKDFLTRVLEAAKQLNFESIHEVFEDDGPEATHISNASTSQSDFVPAQSSLEKAPAKLKESKDIVTSPALEAELEKAGENFFKVPLEFKGILGNPSTNKLYAHGDLGWRKINPNSVGKDHYSVTAIIQGGKVSYYQVHVHHAYDDADYYWAYSYNLKDWFFKLNGTTERFHVQCSTIDDVLKELDRRNSRIEPRMMYDSQEPGSKGLRITEDSESEGYREIPLRDEKVAAVVNSVLGQLSDGYWENSNGSEKYWKFASVKNNTLFISDKRYKIQVIPQSRYVKGTMIQTVKTIGWDNGFLNKSDEEIKKFFARKAKFLIKEEGLEWSRANDEKSKWMSWPLDLTVADVYSAYDWLMGRTRATAPKVSEEKIEESTLTDALDDAMTHLKAAEKHNDNYDTYAVEQDIQGAEGKVHKAQMIAR